MRQIVERWHTIKNVQKTLQYNDVLCAAWMSWLNEHFLSSFFRCLFEPTNVLTIDIFSFVSLFFVQYDNGLSHIESFIAIYNSNWIRYCWLLFGTRLCDTQYLCLFFGRENRFSNTTKLNRYKAKKYSENINLNLNLHWILNFICQRVCRHSVILLFVFSTFFYSIHDGTNAHSKIVF